MWADDGEPVGVALFVHELVDVVFRCEIDQAREQVTTLDRLQTLVDAGLVVASPATRSLHGQGIPIDSGVAVGTTGERHRFAGDLSPFVLVEAEGLQSAVLFLVVEEERRDRVDVGLVGQIECVVVQQRHRQIVSVLEYGNVVALLDSDPYIESVVGGSVNGFEQRQGQIAGLAVFFDQRQEHRALRRELHFLTVGVAEGKLGWWVHVSSLALLLASLTLWPLDLFDAVALDLFDAVAA